MTRYPATPVPIGTNHALPGRRRKVGGAAIGNDW